VGDRHSDPVDRPDRVADVTTANHDEGLPLGPAATRSLSDHLTGTAGTRRSVIAKWFDRGAARVTRWAGSSTAFVVVVAGLVVWGLSGPALGYSSTWQLIVNTVTNIVTFLMVFLIQQSQNKDSVALHLKLDELLATSRRASNRMIGIEGLDEDDLRDMARFYAQLAERARQEGVDHDASAITEPRREHDPSSPLEPGHA
jgi:low affinity Fe/Cu permease